MMDTPCEDLDRGTFEVTSSVQRMMMKRQQQQDNPTEEFKEAVLHSLVMKHTCCITKQITTSMCGKKISCVSPRRCTGRQAIGRMQRCVCSEPYTYRHDMYFELSISSKMKRLSACRRPYCRHHPKLHKYRVET